VVSFFAGLCELCGEADALATPEECRRAGMDVDVSACVACLKRMNPAALDLANGKGGVYEVPSLAGDADTTIRVVIDPNAIKPS
jgi:hypothetical protein